MSVLTSSVIIYKQPSEKLLCSMDFSTWLASASTISDPTVTVDVTGLTITGETVVGQTVELSIAGGTDGQTYRISILVNVSTGEILQGDGILKVKER